MPMRVSVTNLLTQLTPISVSSALAGFPVANLKSPQRPGVLWKSTGMVSESVIWDLGAIPAANAPGFLVLLVNLNLPSMIVAANTTSSFVSPLLSQTQVTVENPSTGRRNFGLWYPTWPYRYLAQIMAGVTPTDGQSVYQCGGIWFGPCLAVPDGLSAHIVADVIKPRTFTEAQSQQFEDYQDRGPARVRVITERRGKVGQVVIGVNDDLSKWQALDRQWGGRPAAVLLTERDPTKAWIMRNIDDLGFTRSPSTKIANQITMVEVLGP